MLLQLGLYQTTVLLKGMFFYKALKCYCWKLVDFSAVDQSYAAICLPHCSTAALK